MGSKAHNTFNLIPENTKSVKQIIVHPFRKDKRERRKKKRENRQAVSSKSRGKNSK
jgi:hypothetical protein